MKKLGISRYFFTLVGLAILIQAVACSNKTPDQSNSNSSSTPVLSKPEASKPSPALSSIGSLKDISQDFLLKPGMVLNRTVYDGTDPRGNLIGDYEFVSKILDNSERGLEFQWSMSYPALKSGVRLVLPEDLLNSHKHSVYFENRSRGPKKGYTAQRISDAVFGDLVAGRVSLFSNDDKKFSPQTIQKTGEEELPILFNDEYVKVKTIKTLTDIGSQLWILNNPKNPIVLKSVAPITKGFLFSVTDTEAFAKKIHQQLQDKKQITTYAILFDFSSNKLKDESRTFLDEVGKFMIQNPGKKLNIEVYSDNIGDPSLNLALTQARAQAIQNYLVQNHHVPADQILPQGFGDTKPVGDNTNSLGRAQNRRVVLKLQ